MVWSEEEFQEFVLAMESDRPTLRITWFQDLWASPSGDARVLPYLEAALSDKTIYLVGAPILYAELAHQAAVALASERRSQGIAEPVLLFESIGTLRGEGLNINNDVSRILNENDAFLKAHYENSVTQPDYSLDHIAAKLNILRQAGRIKVSDYWVISSRTGGSALLPIPQDIKPNP
jgi:hypothetical protein